jgi:hypothetical protein
VNLRVGPRLDVRPVRQLDEGTVLVVVERVPGWLGVQVPEGFPAAVSGAYVTAVGTDAVRVEANRLNLRVTPPQAGQPMPGAFRDPVERGAVLPLVESAGEWVWVMAPEGVRAYVSAEYVRELGPVEEHADLLEAARGRRAARLAERAAARREEAARRTGETLRLAIGQAQQALYRLRLEGGHDRVPVVRVVNDLEQAMDACRDAPLGARKIAQAIRQDLEAELELRTARKDAEVARLRGLEPGPEPTPSAHIESVVVRGTIRWEAAPRWRNGGAWVLWVGEEPRHVLHLTTGLPHPLPDLEGNAGRGPRTVEGRQGGERVFGLPVLEVRSITE